MPPKKKQSRHAIVYYSLTGSTKLIAESIAEEIQADLIRITPKKDQKPGGFMKFFWGGFEALSRKEPELEPLPEALNSCDILWIGMPVWAGTVSPAIRSFMANRSKPLPSVVFFATCDGDEGKTFSEMNALTAPIQPISTKIFTDVLNNRKRASIQAVEWTQTVLSQFKEDIK